MANPVARAVSPPFHPELDTPIWKKCAAIIAELAIRILAPLALCYLLHLILPATISVFVMAPAAIGMAMTVAFFFLQPRISPPVAQPLAPIPAPAPHVAAPARALAPAVAPPPAEPPLPANAPRGIEREGNNCWLNALIQCLRKNRFFADFIGRDAQMVPWRNFFQQYDGAIAGGVNRVPARSQLLREHIARHNPLIPPGHQTQQDPTEALAALFGLVPQAELPIQQRISRTYDMGDGPPVEGYPNGVTERVERSGHISIGISGEAPTFEQLMAQHAREENHDPDNRVRITDTRSCKLLRTEISFPEGPQDLLVSLNRFTFRPGPSTLLSRVCDFFGLKFCRPLDGTVLKKHTPVPIPSQYVLPTDRGPVNYDLDSFVVHHGESANSGHYVAYVKNGNDWFLADDRMVRPVSEEEAKRAAQQAYLIHFARREVPNVVG